MGACPHASLVCLNNGFDDGQSETSPFITGCVGLSLPGWINPIKTVEQA
jgi:hypothetical protein